MPERCHRFKQYLLERVDSMRTVTT